MVDRHERDLRAAIPGIGEQAVVSCHELVVKDRLESRRDTLARALDMRSDQRRLCDNLVLKTCVELHVPCLVDLLCRKERDLLLAGLAPTSPENFVVIRSSATISEPRTNDTSERSSGASHCSQSVERSTSHGLHWLFSQWR